MDKIVHFDVAAVFILVIILGAAIYRKMSKGTTNRIFTLLIATTLAAAVFEIILVAVGANGRGDDFTLTLFRSLYMLAHNLATPVYLMYVISLTKTWHMLAQKPAICVLMSVPYLIDITLIIINCFTGFMFKYENGVEVQKNVLPFYLCAVAYIVAAIYLVVRFKKLFQMHQLFALASMAPLCIAAVIIKQFFSQSLIEVFASAIGVLIMSLIIQRPELIIDATTRLKKYSAYADDMKTIFANKEHVNVIMINIANYNKLNRFLGYDEMQKLLRSIAEGLEAINSKIGAHAEIYYLDRGRYRIIVNSFNKKSAVAMAEAANTVVKQDYLISQTEIDLKAYVCLTRCPEDTVDFKSLMSFGNDFHEKIPHNGELIFAEELFKQRNFSLENELDDIIENALTNHKLKVYYQPIYSAKEQRFTSAEALIRLIDDTHGFIPPDIFIPHSEKTGAIHKIGTFVLESVCSFIASDEYKQLGLDYIEINLSVAQCMQSTLADDVIEMLTKYNIKPSQVNLEITETAASYNQKVMEENLDVLTSAGVSFSLDDFGTGYSNIDRVASLPLKIVKLDRSLVINTQKPKMEKFVENIIRMFKDMDMEIVVEGIETKEMVEHFSELGCDYIQGYFFSKPIPQNEFVAFVSSAR